MACMPVRKTLREDFSQLVYLSCTASGSELNSLVSMSELPSQILPIEFCPGLSPLLLGSIQVKVAKDLIVIAFLEELLHYSTAAPGASLLVSVF